MKTEAPFGFCWYWLPHPKRSTESIPCCVQAKWRKEIAGREVYACDDHGELLDKDVLPNEQLVGRK